MKRFPIFIALFPLACFVMFGDWNRLNVGPLHELLAAAYMLLIIPALVVAAVDALVRNVLAVVVAGFIMPPFAAYLAFGRTMGFGVREVIYFGAVGAASALACWLVAMLLNKQGRAQ
jgi:hypothetical protein